MPESVSSAGSPKRGDAKLRAVGADGAVQASAVAAALAVDAARYDPQLSREVEAYLREQTALAAHQLAAARGGHLASRGWLERFSERARSLLPILVAAGVVAMAAGLALMVRDAVDSRTVVIDAFDTPAGLAPRGLTGRVVAGAVLDELSRLQSATRSAASKRQISNAWTGDIKVEVPQTGVSIGEIDRLLKERFSHDLHIGGDLIVTDTGGLRLTVRGNGVLPKSFEGGMADLAKLTTQAAEYIYGQSEPSLYVTFLYNNGRNPEAVTFASKAYASAPVGEQPYLLNGWANALLNTGAPLSEPLKLYREAVRLKPDYWIGYNNIINALWGLGDEEGAWRTGFALEKAAGGRPGASPENNYQNWDALTWNLQAWLASTLADSAISSGIGTSVTTNGPTLADIRQRMHDLSRADLELRTAVGGETDPTVAAMTHFVRGRIASEEGRAVAEASEMEAFLASYANPIVSSNYPGYACWAAPSEEAVGKPAASDAILSRWDRFVDCRRFRGDILDGRGDWPGAQRAYASAVALAPDLPGGYYSWGVALARHGDLKGAAAKLAAANAKGAGWADPLKAWGDVLVRQGKAAEAGAKYDDALKLAPTWTLLRQARAKLAPAR